MGTLEINDFYDRQIAAMSPEDQLLLAGQIIERVARSQIDPLAHEDALAIAGQQRAALKSVIPMFAGQPTDASMRHDDIVYDEPGL